MSTGNDLNTEAAAFLERCGKDEIELHSLLIGNSNKVLFKGYFEPYQEDNLHVLFSISKSFTCMALGLLYDDGKVNLDVPLISYYPEYKELADGYMKEVTLDHLLAMNAGTDQFTTAKICTHGPDDDWAANYFADRLVHKTGTYFQYNTPASYMIGRTVTQISGKKPLDLLQERIFRVMEIRDVQWDECPLGFHTGGWGLWMRPADLYKIGQLFLKRGTWQGAVLLSAAWIEKMMEAASDTSRLGDPTECGYGYQTWLNASGGYSFRGMFGQFCYMIPEKDCVIVVTGGTHEKEKLGRYVEEMARRLPDLHRPETSETVVRKDLQLFCEDHRKDGRSFGLGEGYTEFAMLPNKEGYAAIGFSFTADKAYLHLSYNREQGGYHNVLPLGYGTWEYGTRTCKGQISCWSGGTRKTAACVRAKDRGFAILLRFTESSNAEYWDVTVKADTLVINRHLNCGDHGDISMVSLQGQRDQGQRDQGQRNRKREGELL